MWDEAPRGVRRYEKAEQPPEARGEPAAAVLLGEDPDSALEPDAPTVTTSDAEHATTESGLAAGGHRQEPPAEPRDVQDPATGFDREGRA